MSNYTTNYNLKKPLKSEPFTVTDANDNMDSIDDILIDKVDKISGKDLSTNDYTNVDKAKIGYVGSAILAYSNSSLTTTSGVETKILVNQTSFNTDTNVFEISNDGIKCKISGTYNISVKTSFLTTGTSGRIGCSVMKNSTQYLLGYYALRENYQRAMGSIVLELSANDMLYLYCYQNSTSTRTLDNSLDGNFISVVKIG